MRQDKIEKFSDFLALVTEALARFDYERVHELTRWQLPDLLEKGIFPAISEAEKLLGQLRGHRRFEDLRFSGDTFHLAGVTSMTIGRLYAQAMIELRMYHGADTVLREMEDQTGPGHKEFFEIVGLRGRVAKQAFEDAPAIAGGHRRSSLLAAIDHYRRAYEADPSTNLWHGVNLAALLRRTEREEIDPPADLDAAFLARRIVAEIESKENLDEWDLATAAEAFLAIEGREDDSVKWMAEYCRHKEVSAFTLGSTHRQMVEIWKLDASQSPGNKILPLLESSLLSRKDGSLSVSLTSVDLESTTRGRSYAEASSSGMKADNTGFEAILGKDRYKDIRWYQTGLERASSVARILDQYEGQGTGFLVEGNDLSPKWKDEGLLLVTNAHVVSNLEEENRQGSLFEDEARVQFQVAKGTETSFDIDEILWSSPRHDHDASILRIKNLPQDLEAVPLAKRISDKGNQRVYVIGHPKGGSLSFSLHDNHLEGFDEKPENDPRYLFYRAPTEGGSSGSPVFNRRWDLIGLHHYGARKPIQINGERRDDVANEGVVFQSIVNAIATDLGGA